MQADVQGTACCSGGEIVTMLAIDRLTTRDRAVPFPMPPHSKQPSRGPWRLWLLALLLACGHTCTLAAEILPQQARNALGPQAPLSWVEDQAGDWLIEDVAALSPDRFSKGPTLSAGYTRSVYWVRVAGDMRWPTDIQWLEFRPPFLDRLDVYQAHEEGWRVQRLGDILPRERALLDYRHLVVPVVREANRPPVVFVRLQTTSAMLLDVRWWTPEGFAAQASRDSTQWGLYFGVAALSVLLSLGLALLIRSRKLWALSSFSVAYVLVASNQGFMGWLVIPSHPYLVHLLPGLSVFLGQAATFWMMKETLDLREHLPRLDRMLTVVIGLLLLSCLSVPLDFYTELAVPSLFVAETCKWVAAAWGVVLWRRHGRMYGAITVAFALHALTALLTVLTLGGALPLYMWALQAWQYGLVMLMLVVAGVSLVQVRQDHLRRLTEKTQALLATEEARAMLAQRVTERTQELEAMRDELAQALRHEQEAHFQQRQLVGLVSHEFRTPLAVIDIVLNNLALVPPETLEEMQHRLAEIREANRHLVQLTDTCLADARLGAGLLQLNRAEPLDLRELVSSTLDMLYGTGTAPLNALVRPGTDAHSSDETVPLTVWGDAGLLRIALFNVLENARKYAGGKVVHLNHHIERGEPSRVRLRVHDQGPGVAEDVRERIFERFTRGNNVGGKRGNGLGLFISREIMRAHRGDLRLLPKQEQGQLDGCVFEFDWPLHTENRTSHDERHPCIPSADCRD
jgi:signal transduction histidine kinase